MDFKDCGCSISERVRCHEYYTFIRFECIGALLRQGVEFSIILIVVSKVHSCGFSLPIGYIGFVIGTYRYYARSSGFKGIDDLDWTDLISCQRDTDCTGIVLTYVVFSNQVLIEALSISREDV